MFASVPKILHTHTWSVFSLIRHSHTCHFPPLLGVCKWEKERTLKNVLQCSEGLTHIHRSFSRRFAIHTLVTTFWNLQMVERTNTDKCSPVLGKSYTHMHKASSRRFAIHTIVTTTSLNSLRFVLANGENHTHTQRKNSNLLKDLSLAHYSQVKCYY